VHLNLSEQNRGGARWIKKKNYCEKFFRIIKFRFAQF